MNVLRRNLSLQGSISKLDVWIIEPQSIFFGNRTSKFALESFDCDNLHLDPPRLDFKILQKPSWYSNVPITLIALATNLRFQPITDAMFDISVQAENRVIFSAHSQRISAIGAHRTETFCFRFTPPSTQQNLRVFVAIKHVFDGQASTNAMQISMPIFPSVNCMFSQKGEYIGFEIENMFQFPLTNVSVAIEEDKASLASRSFDDLSNETLFPQSKSYSGLNTLSMYAQRILSVRESGKSNIVTTLVASKLVRNEKIFGFTKKSNSFQIGWALPFASDCVMSFTLRSNEADVKRKISFRFIRRSKSPKIVSCFQPFQLCAKIKNNLKEKISGSFAFKENPNIIFFGKSNMIIDLGPKEGINQDFPFMTLKEGAFPLPDLIFTYKNKNGIEQFDVFEFSDIGVISVGNNS